MALTVDGRPVTSGAIDEIAAPDGTRLHRLAAAPVGRLVVDYTATVASGAAERPVSPLEAIVFTRPSRYSIPTGSRRCQQPTSAVCPARNSLRP